jgi:hypothetical protein
VNAVALAALLAVAVAIRVVWRGEATVESGALRPSAIVTALGGAGVAAGPLALVDVTNGHYERAQGGPILFVRGKVVCRAALLRAPRVEVELVRDGRVIGRGAARAGALPTAEELHAASDGPALEALLAALAARAPAEVRPGETVPFLVPVADAPDDLEGASLRVTAAPAEGSRP